MPSLGSTTDRKSIDDSDLQIVHEIPGKINAGALGGLGSLGYPGGLGDLTSLLGGGGGSGAGGFGYNPSSILQAQDPYFASALSSLQAGSSSSSNSSMDILQKCKLHF